MSSPTYLSEAQKELISRVPILACGIPPASSLRKGNGFLTGIMVGGPFVSIRPEKGKKLLSQ